MLYLGRFFGSVFVTIAMKRFLEGMSAANLEIVRLTISKKSISKHRHILKILTILYDASTKRQSYGLDLSTMLNTSSLVPPETMMKSIRFDSDN